MTNQQLYLAIGIPAFLVLFNTAALFSLFAFLANRLDKMEGRLDSRLDRMDGKLDLIQKDQKEFYGTQRVHDSRLDALERKP